MIATYCAAIADLLASVGDWTICGEAKNGQEAHRNVREMQPDLVLLDMSLADTNGLEISDVFGCLRKED